MNLQMEIDHLKSIGYSELNASARLCQDIVLAAIKKSSFSQHVTIKGGVVMRNLSKNQRRATQDLDFDFIHYPLTTESLHDFVRRLNCLEDITLFIMDPIEELNHLDYKGRRIHLGIRDQHNTTIVGKLDIGIHKNTDICQNQYCFDLCFSDEGASLLMNSPEQVFVEKLKSLLRFGLGSTRYKDIFDLCYLLDYTEISLVVPLIEKIIFQDSTLSVNTLTDIQIRLQNMLQNKRFMHRVMASGKNWLELNQENVEHILMSFLRKWSDLYPVTEKTR